MKITRCPICQSVTTRNYAKRDNYSYRHCIKCNHVFLFPIPSSSSLLDLYSGDYEFRVNATARNRFEKQADTILKNMRRLNPQGKTLLDVGAGYGTFVEMGLRNQLKAVGIEPARNLYRQAKTRLGDKIIHADLNEFVKRNNKIFDFISLIHVVEHVENPAITLSTLYQLLKLNGVLYVETPNIDSFLSDAEKSNYTFLTPPDHLNLFSSRSFKTLLNSLDLPLKASYSTYSYPEHFVGILRSSKSKLFHNHVSTSGSTQKTNTKNNDTVSDLPFFDRVVAPALTPLLNIGNRGSILQIYIQKMN